MTSSPSSSSGPNANAGGLDSELESFRQQWISDIQHQNEPQHTQQPYDGRTASSTAAPSHHGNLSASNLNKTSKPKSAADHDDDYYLEAQTFDEPSATSPAARHELNGVQTQKKLVSALDHYEEAMAKEALGNMGDSLKLYRKAYRLDNGVDRLYREKHFPKAKAPVPSASSSTATTTTTTTKTGAPITTPSPSSSTSAPPPAPLHANAAPEEVKPLSIGQLLASFASLKIEAVPPEVEGMPAPPCPLADLPEEILIHIMRDVAIADVADFARLSRVCKRMAYLVATEQRIWRRVAIGSEVGFPNMIYRFQKSIEWAELDEEEQIQPQVIDGFVISPAEIAQRRRDAAAAYTESLTPSVYPTWKSHFRSRPRIRFNGCYICTVNYVRMGQASTNQTTWGTPIHIVTYYRYLRFFRDGTSLSLLTTSEPTDVVHHLTREAFHLHRDSAQHHLPSAVMALAQRGRWRLSSVEDIEDPDSGALRDGNQGPESNLVIETQGVLSKYMYRMDLSLRSAGKGSRNNKFVWRGYYSYNKLTDDWAEFALKHEKPYFFSRVKSYGFGE